MKTSCMNRYLQQFYQRIFLGHRALTYLRPLLPSRINGLCNGYWVEFDIGEDIQRAIYLDRYEPKQSCWVRDILKPGSIFLDVGANVGYYTMLAASLVGSKGRVLAFEPSPYAFNRLAAIVQNNRITQVSAFQCAVGDKEGWLDLYLPNENKLHSPSLVPSDKLFTPVKVEVCQLDSHPSLETVPMIDLMKVDVEGFEPNVLRGMSKKLHDGRVKYLMCEFNSGWLERNESDFEDLLKSVMEMGFVKYKETPKLTLIGDKGLVFHLQDILFKHISC